MEVAHKSDTLNHAVISTAPVQSYSVNLSAEFITTMTKTLYPNPILAMIREILCNGWDAHKIVGKDDVPIEITTTDGRFAIRDFGPGIPHDKVLEIYCSYGSSTKTKLANQTGGFGLGAKTPFAYTDFFTMRNHHAGELAVWNMTLGSTLTDGLPDARCVTRIPSTSTGVEVSVSYVNEDIDRKKLIEYAKQVAKWGGMRVIIDGIPVDYYDLNDTDQKYLLTGDTPYCDATGKLFVQCGNVVYPIPNNVAYDSIYRELSNMRGPRQYDAYYHNSDNARLPLNMMVFAEPNSLSYTPSRDALHMCETTIANIKEMLTKLLDHLKDPAAIGSLNKAVKAIVTEVMNTGNPKHIAALYVTEYIGTFSTNTETKKVPHTSEGAWKNEAYYNYGDFLVKWGLRDYQLLSDSVRTSILVTSRKLIRDAVKALPNKPQYLDLRDFINEASKESNVEALLRCSFYGLFKKRLNHFVRAGVDPGNVIVWTPDGYRFNTPIPGYHYTARKHIRIMDLSPMIPRVVILIRAAYQLNRDAIHKVKACGGPPNRITVIIHPKTSTVPIEVVEANLTRMNFIVINEHAAHVKRVEQERAIRIATLPPKTARLAAGGVRKPRPKGIPTLANLAPRDALYPSPVSPSYKNFLYTPAADRNYTTATPKFYLKGYKTANTSTTTCMFLPHTDTPLKDILALYGDVGVVCVNNAQEEKFVNMKIPEGLKYISTDVYKRLSGNKDYILSMAQDMKIKAEQGSITETLRSVPELRPLLLPDFSLESTEARLHELRKYFVGLKSWLGASNPLCAHIAGLETDLTAKINAAADKPSVVKRTISYEVAQRLEAVGYQAIVRQMSRLSITPDVRGYLLKVLTMAITNKPSGKTP